ncbi:GNAT family N-acetyltransferase [Aquisalimonas sp.]|uniref:GNAT family N-acetyltransferase n=1 Tax=Aquisalimonas sp. TaxID=1872621 RepID=UPI0025BEAE99|nr:GNAT family N-acetyltransferase [Aquisalimonas sp.]
MVDAFDTKDPWANEPVIRQLWWSERKQWCAHLLRLSPEDRRHRFAGEVTDAFIRSYCEAADPFVVIVFGAFVDGELRAVGEFALLERACPRRCRAELAFSVEAGWQGQGLGTALFRSLVMHARNRSVAHIYLVTEPDNSRMHRIASKFGMTTSPSDEDPTRRVELHGPSYCTVIGEMMTEGVALLRHAPELPQLPKETAGDA